MSLANHIKKAFEALQKNGLGWHLLEMLEVVSMTEKNEDGSTIFIFEDNSRLLVIDSSNIKVIGGQGE